MFLRLYGGTICQLDTTTKKKPFFVSRKLSSDFWQPIFMYILVFFIPNFPFRVVYIENICSYLKIKILNISSDLTDSPCRKMKKALE